MNLLSQEGHDNMITKAEYAAGFKALHMQIHEPQKNKNNKMKLYIEQVDELPLCGQTFENLIQHSISKRYYS